MLLVALPAFAQQPTTITFFVPHARCDDVTPPSTLELLVNQQRIAVETARVGCECSTEAASTFEYTAPEILALLDPASCNTFRVDVDRAGAAFYVGALAVRVSTGASSEESCLFEAAPFGVVLECRGDPCQGFGDIIDTSGEPDLDGDGIPSGVGVGGDNCPFGFNPQQADSDGDGIGDVCDRCPTDAAPEPDADGVCSAIDNCPDRPNSGQQDADHDRIGAACTDPDDDYRTAFFPNPFPNACPVDDCPGVSNPDQRDTDFLRAPGATLFDP